MKKPGMNPDCQGEVSMKVILTGSIAFDYLMQFPGLFKDHLIAEHLDKVSLSFLVHKMIKQDGGVGPNIAYTLAMLGGKAYLFSTAGQDFGEYARRLEQVGVDTSGVRIIPDKFTASFFATTDRSNAQIATFYTGAMANAAELPLAEADFEADDFVMVSPSDPGAMRRYIREAPELGLRMLFDPGQQIISLDAEGLRDGVEHAHGLFINEYEFELLQKHTGWRAEEILAKPAFTVVTLAEHGARVVAEGVDCVVPAIGRLEVKDPTGVGDAFRGGFLRGYMAGMPLKVCVELGNTAAAYCIQEAGPQCHKYSWAEFVAFYREHFDDEGLLDEIE
jgi:adenosine kinase